MTHRRVDLHGIDPVGPVAVQRDDLRLRPRNLGPDGERQADAHAAEGAGVEPVAGRERRDRLAAEVQDLLAVDHEDGVALEEVAHLLAEAQRMDGRLVGRHRAVRLGLLLGVDGPELPHPSAVAGRIDAPARLGGELLQHGAGVPGDGHVGHAVVAELGGVDVHVDDLEVGGEARRAPELDDVVEAAAHDQERVGLGEGLGPGVEEGQRVVLRDQAARDRRGVERNARRLDERPKGGGGVGPPDAAPPEDDRALGARQERDGLADRRGVALGPGRRPPHRGIRHRRLVHRLAEDVTGQVEVDGARPAGGGVAERGGDQLGDAPGVEHPLRPLGDGPHDRHLIDLLEGLHAEIHPRARSPDPDDRRRVGECIGEAGGEVGRAGARGGHAHAGTLGDARPGMGHHARRLLVARVDGPHAELDDLALRLEHGPAHEEEEGVHALRFERPRQQLRSGDRPHHPVLSGVRPWKIRSLAV